MKFEGPIKHSERDAQMMWYAKIGILLGDEIPKQSFPTNRQRKTNVDTLFKPSYVCYTWYLTTKNPADEIIKIPLVTRTLGSKTIGKTTIKFLAGLQGAKDRLRHHGGKPKRKETKGWFNWVKRFAGKREELTQEEKEKILDEAEELEELGYDADDDKAAEFIRRTALMEALEEFTPDKATQRTDREYLPFWDNNWTFASVREAAGKIQDYRNMGFLEFKANGHLQKLLKSDKVPEAIKYMLKRIRDEENTGNWYVRAPQGENMIEDDMHKSWYEILKKPPEEVDPEDEDEDEDEDETTTGGGKRDLGEELKDPFKDTVREQFDRYTGRPTPQGEKEHIGSREFTSEHDQCCARLKRWIAQWIEHYEPQFYDRFADMVLEDLEEMSCKELADKMEGDTLDIAGVNVQIQRKKEMEFLGDEGKGNPQDKSRFDEYGQYRGVSMREMWEDCVMLQLIPAAGGSTDFLVPEGETEDFYEDMLSPEEAERIRRKFGRNVERVGQGKVTPQEMTNNDLIRELYWDALDKYRDKKGLPPIDRKLKDFERGEWGAKENLDLAVADDEMILWSNDGCPACVTLKEWLRDRNITIQIKDPDRQSAPREVNAVPTLQLDASQFIIGEEDIKDYFKKRGMGGRST